MSLSRAMWKITGEHTSKLAYVFVRRQASRGVSENTIGIMVPCELELQALQLGWREENIKVIEEKRGCGGTAEGSGGYEQLLNVVSDGRVGAVFFLEPSRVARDIADWNNFIKVCQRAGTLVINTLAIYDARDVNDNMMLMLRVLLAEAEQKVITDQHQAKRSMTAKGERRPSARSATSRTMRKR